MYQAQSGYYKVKPHNSSARWQDHNTARLQISIGNKLQTGAKLQALVEWACGGRFERVEVIVSDTLNWFNIAFREQIPKAQAIDKALRSGEQWINDNSCLREHPVIIRRWNEWYLHESYKERLSAISSIYQESYPLQHSIQEVSERVWSAKSNQEFRAAQRQEEFFDISKNYILNELSVFSLLFNERNAIEVYPGAWFKDMFDILCNYSEHYPYLECFRDKAYLRVEFLKNKSFKTY